MSEAIGASTLTIDHLKKMMDAIPKPPKLSNSFPPFNPLIPGRIGMIEVIDTDDVRRIYKENEQLREALDIAGKVVKQIAEYRKLCTSKTRNIHDGIETMKLVGEVVDKYVAAYYQQRDDLSSPPNAENAEKELKRILSDILFWAKWGKEFYEEYTGNETYCSKEEMEKDFAEAAAILGCEERSK